MIVYGKKKNSILILTSIFVAFISIFFMYRFFGDDRILRSIDFQRILNILLIFEYGWSFFCYHKSGKSIFSFFGLFLIYLFLSMASQTLLRFFPEFPTSLDSVYNDFSIESVNKMLLYQMAIVPSMTFGALFGGALFNRWKLNKINSTIAVKRENIFSHSIRVVFLILFVLVSYYAITMLVQRFTMSYGEYYYNEEKGTISAISLFLFSCSLVYLLFKGTELRRIAFVSVIFLILIYMISGTRSQAIPFLSICIVIYAQVRKHKISKKEMWLFSIIGLVAIELLGAITYLRGADIGQLSITSYFEEGFFENIKETLYEMGMSAQTITITINKIDGGYARSQTILYNFVVAFIPRPVLALAGITAPQIGAYSTWISGLMNSQSGYGSSFIGECYLNFAKEGWLFAILYGCVAIFFESVCYDKFKRGYYLFPCVGYAILSKTIFFARGQFDYFTSYLRFSFIIFLIYFIFFSSYRKTMVYSRSNVRVPLEKQT